MALADFFARLKNIWDGILGITAKNIESNNPDAVYEAAIQERLKKHGELKKATEGIVYLRQKTENELGDLEKRLAEIDAQLPIAVERNEESLALALLEEKNGLQGRVQTKRGELEQLKVQADAAKAALLEFRNEVEKLKSERIEMMARKQSAEALVKARETLDGLSTDADIKALESVRESVGRMEASAEIAMEGGATDALKRRTVEREANRAMAKAQLDELKKQMAARSAGAVAEGGAAKKTL